MVWFKVGGGAQALTVGGGETSLVQDDRNGTYVLHLDVSPMLSGDTIEVTAYTKVNASDSFQRQFKWTLTDAQTNKNQQFPGPTEGGLVSPVDVEWRLNQTAGTTRTIPWAVYRN